MKRKNNGKWVVKKSGGNRITASLNGNAYSGNCSNIQFMNNINSTGNNNRSVSVYNRFGASSTATTRTGLGHDATTHSSHLSFTNQVKHIYLGGCQ